MTKTPSGRRFDFETRAYTNSEHQKVWLRQIKIALRELLDALRNPPPWTYTAEIEVPKDDPRYETAPIGEEWLHFGTGEK